MSISYGEIDQIIGVEVQKIDDCGNLLIDLRLLYVKRDGRTQEHLFPTTPEIAYMVLDDLIKMHPAKKGFLEENKMLIR